LELKTNYPEKINFHCDPILLGKAISAVVKNAIVYNKKGGMVEVNIDYAKFTVDDAYMYHPNPHKQNQSPTNQSLQIKITDTGIGIAKEFQEKVFEKFFRVDSSLTYEVSGVGVGLYIARKIIQLHNGNMSLKTELKNGTTITINIPYAI